jgi:putative flippase GtrA
MKDLPDAVATKASMPWFVGVGAAATLVHFATVVALVSLADWQPLGANVIAWGVAFAVSFFGHWRLSFGAQQAPLWRAAFRFVVVSAAGFGVNQLAYALLLKQAGWGYASALAVVLAAVAVLTYAISRNWAFTSRVPPPR